MSEEGLRSAVDKMADAGIDQVAIDVFNHYYRELESGGTGLIREDEIEPVSELPRLADQQVDAEAARDAFDKTVVIRLNGGLGTSMGMEQAKSLLPVRGDKTFLDLIVDQVRHARTSQGVRLPLLLMNSFRTREDSLAALSDQPDVAVDDLPLDFLQNQEPKLRTDDLTPVEWPDDPTLEWCPPGHGDIYTALLSSGILETLLERGYRYATVSNSDNLGTVPDPTLAGWFAGTGAPFAMEVCRRTPADRKGGHLARRRSDGRLVLREVAQTDEADMEHFTDENTHVFFNTNSLWWDLQQLHEVLREREGVLGLPLIRNTKTVDPADKESPEVFQIETAMGAAIEVFEGATAIEVGRDRFLPVKTTDDLLLMRSDCYELGEDAALTATVETMPLVELDKEHYKTVGDFDERFAHGAPSLQGAQRFAVEGDVRFGADVSVRGEVTVTAEGTGGQVADGTVLEGSGREG